MHSCHLKHFVYYGHLVLCDITSIMVGTVSICLFAALDGAKKTFMLLEFFAPCEGEVPWSCYARIIKVKIYKAIYKAKNKNKKSMRSMVKYQILKSYGVCIFAEVHREKFSSGMFFRFYRQKWRKFPLFDSSNNCFLWQIFSKRKSVNI